MKKTTILIIVVLVIAIAVLLYFVLRKKDEKQSAPPAPVPQPNTNSFSELSGLVGNMITAFQSNNNGGYADPNPYAGEPIDYGGNSGGYDMSSMA